MPSHRRRRTAVATLALLLALAVALPSAQAAPPSGRLARSGGPAAGAGRGGPVSSLGGWLVADAAGRLAAWLSGPLVSLLGPPLPGGGPGPQAPQVTCDAGSQLDPNGKCVPIPTTGP